MAEKSIKNQNSMAKVDKLMNTVLIDALCLANAKTGIATYTNELVSALQQEDLVDCKIWPRQSTLNRIRIFTSGNSKLSRWTFQLVQLLWKAIILPLCLMMNRNIKAVISPDYVGPFWSFGKLKIVVVHSPFFWDYPKNYSAKWLTYYKWLMQQSLRSNAVIVTTSQFVKDRIDDHFELPIEVVYQVAKSFTQEHPGTIRPEIAAICQEQFYLHVGYFDKRKNLETLVRAYEQSRLEKKLVLAGGRGIGFANDDYSKVISLINELGIQDHVLLTGFVNEHELEMLYQSAYIYIFPSYSEGFGIPALEAFSYELPVIVSNSGALPEIASNAALIFNTFEPEDLSKKMVQLDADIQLRDELIKRGKERLKDFTSKKFANQFEELIRKYA